MENAATRLTQYSNLKKIDELYKRLDIAERKRKERIARVDLQTLTITPIAPAPSKVNQTNNLSSREVKEILQNDFNIKNNDSIAKDSDLDLKSIFKCRYCPQRFKTLGWYIKHITNLHDDVNEVAQALKSKSDLIKILKIDNIFDTETKEIIPEYSPQMKQSKLNTEKLQIIEVNDLDSTKDSDKIIEILQQNLTNTNTIGKKFAFEKKEFFNVFPFDENVQLQVKNQLEIFQNILKNLEIELNKFTETISMIEKQKLTVVRQINEITILIEMMNETFVKKFQIEIAEELRETPTVDVKQEKEIVLENVNEDDLVEIIEVMDESDNDEELNFMVNIEQENVQEIESNQMSSPTDSSLVSNSKSNWEQIIPNIVADENGKYPCSKCGTKVSSLSILKMHFKRKHLNEKDKICPYCKRCFTSTGDLTRHIRCHENDRPFQCTFPSCQLAFVSSGDLYKHARKHIKSTSTSTDCGHECSVCGKKFESNVQLKRHLDTHRMKNDDPTFTPFECEFCFKQFGRKDQLKSHMIRHLDIKVFQCRYCDRKFSDCGNRNAHENIIHLKGVQLKCHYCQLEFETKALLKGHWKEQCRVISLRR